MALAIDGTASLYSSSGTSVQVTLTTTAAGLIAVAILANSSTVSTVTDSAGLTYTKRSSGGSPDVIEYWYAKSLGAHASDVITVTFVGTATFCSVAAFGISGCDTTNPFDTNAALPNHGNADPRSITTSNVNDMLLYMGRSSTATNSAASGWTLILTGGFLLTQYQIVSATQSALSVSLGSGTSNGCIADAVIQASGGGSNRVTKMASYWGGFAGESGGFAG